MELNEATLDKINTLVEERSLTTASITDPVERSAILQRVKMQRRMRDYATADQNRPNAKIWGDASRETLAAHHPELVKRNLDNQKWGLGGPSIRHNY